MQGGAIIILENRGFSINLFQKYPMDRYILIEDIEVEMPRKSPHIIPRLKTPSLLERGKETNCLACTAGISSLRYINPKI